MTEKPALGLFGRRGFDPGVIEVTGAKVYALLGPWYQTSDDIPVSFDVLARRAETLREMGVEVWLYGYPNGDAWRIRRWVDAMKLAVDAVKPDLLLVDLEAPMLTGSAHRTSICYDALASSLDPSLPIGVTHVPASSEGIDLALDRSTLVMPQCYKGEPGPDRARLKEVHAAAPHARLTAATPGFGEHVKNRTLPAYLDGLVGPPVDLWMVWPPGKGEAQVPAWVWDVYAERTDRKLVCGPEAG